jgi:hypothetical protein
MQANFLWLVVPHHNLWVWCQTFISWCCIEYTSPITRFELQTGVISTVCTGSYKSNYHTITITTDPMKIWNCQVSWKIDSRKIFVIVIIAITNLYRIHCSPNIRTTNYYRIYFSSNITITHLSWIYFSSNITITKIDIGFWNCSSSVKWFWFGFCSFYIFLSRYKYILIAKNR